MIENLAVVDTDVFSVVLAPRRDDIRPLYEEDLIGRKLAISFQTAAELRLAHSLEAGARSGPTTLNTE